MPKLLSKEEHREIIRKAYHTKVTYKDLKYPLVVWNHFSKKKKRKLIALYREDTKKFLLSKAISRKLNK